jgi:formylglycine-generating enzyme required for sulfatase activity
MIDSFIFISIMLCLFFLNDISKMEKIHETINRGISSRLHIVFQDRLKDGSLGPKMADLPAATFRMGDIQGGIGNEKPVHSVHVDGFAMGVNEVTVAEFRQFVNATGYRTEAEKGDGCYVYQQRGHGVILPDFLKMTRIRLFVSVGTMRQHTPTG